jgi:hypothetical protein
MRSAPKGARKCFPAMPYCRFNVKLFLSALLIPDVVLFMRRRIQSPGGVLPATRAMLSGNGRDFYCHEMRSFYGCARCGVFRAGAG